MTIIYDDDEYCDEHIRHVIRSYRERVGIIHKPKKATKTLPKAILKKLAENRAARNPALS
jgi:hypothetical protein